MKRNLLFASLNVVVVIAAACACAAQTSATSAAPVRATIPFELVTRHIMVKVTINNSRPLSFVFDTGDKVGIVDADVAKELGLKLEGQLRVGGAGADTLSGSFVKGANWSLPGVEGFLQPISVALPLARM